MSGQKWLGLFFSCFFPLETFAVVDYARSFSDQDACFIVSDMQSGKTVAVHNEARCNTRLPPCSTFKIPAAVMAFETGKLKDADQVIKWDGKKHPLESHNQDLTPSTWMKHSAVWVTQWLMPQIGLKLIQIFLNDFSYGNRDFSGGVTEAWLMSSLKISAVEQISFLRKLWKGELPLKKRTVDLTKQVLYIQPLDKASLYGKTGTGCLSGHVCMSRPDKMLGWFVGVLKNGSKEYVFAANASDLKPAKSAAGPRVRESVVQVLGGLHLTK